MKYLLYKLDRNNLFSTDKKEEYIIKNFSPKPWDLYMREEKISIRECFFRFYISSLTLGNVKIYYIEDKKGNILHSSYVIPHNFKYPFLKVDEFAIGPCNTEKNYRGMGLYPYMLKFIILNNDKNDFYMFIRENNISSINGVKKAGFVLCDKEYISRTHFLHRFVIKQ